METFWTDANGVPWTTKYIACLGDPIAGLTEDMAAEQKARSTYEHLIAATCDPLAKDTLRFLWQREVVHFQRFGRRSTQCRNGWATASICGWATGRRRNEIGSGTGKQRRRPLFLFFPSRKPGDST